MSTSQIVLVTGEKAENEFIERYGDKISCIIRYCNITIEGEQYEDIPTHNIDYLDNLLSDTLFVLAGFTCYFEILKTLNSKGFRNCYSIPEYEASLLYEQRGQFNVFLFLTPDYGNIGDQAIASAEVQIIHRLMPKYSLIEIDLGLYRRVKPWLKKIVFPEDRVYITGGGFLGSLWMSGGEGAVRDIISEFPNNEIVVFPQSLFFERDEFGLVEKMRTKEIYGRHKRLKLILREDYSYDLAFGLLPEQVQVFELPDIVLSMNVDVKLIDHSNKGKMAGIGLKSDKESLMTIEDKKLIRNLVERLGYEFVEFSTQKKKRIVPQKRDVEIKEKLAEIAQYSLVITDCLHGMIFCALTGTPCVALDQISHKVRGEYKWLRELPFIQFVDDIKGVNNNVIEKVVNEERSDRFSYAYYEEELKAILTDRKGEIHDQALF